MLEFYASNDKGLLDRLCVNIFGHKFVGNVGYILLYKDEPIGIAKLMTRPDESHISFVGILKEHRKMGFGDFFTRSLMNTLSYVSEKIVVDYVSDYFLKFGFKQLEDRMEIVSRYIVFPSKCKGC